MVGKKNPMLIQIMVIFLGYTSTASSNSHTRAMDLVDPELSSFFLVIWEEQEGGLANLRTVTVGDQGSTVPDQMPYIFLMSERHGGGPSQLVSMLVHRAGSPFVYLYITNPTEIPIPHTPLIATPLIADGVCLVIYSR